MSGHRQAAAVLHGLAEEDRALILAELPAADQATLQAYLQELQELGFEGGPGVVAAPAGNARQVLERAAAPAMLALLAAEPASLVGQLLALGPWLWADELLAQLPAARRELVQAAAARKPAPAMERFLLDETARRLGEDAAPAQPARRGLLKPLLRLVQPWTR